MSIIKIRLTKKTKKEQICHECKGKIPQGSEVYYTSGKDSLGFYSRYSHTKCFLEYLEKNNLRISPELMTKEEQ